VGNDKDSPGLFQERVRFYLTQIWRRALSKSRARNFPQKTRKTLKMVAGQTLDEGGAASVLNRRSVATLPLVLGDHHDHHENFRVLRVLCVLRVLLL